MTFPSAVPEIPSADVGKSAAYYVNALGFTLDWGDDQGGIAGISRGNCRLFLTNRSFREPYGNVSPVLFWLNLDSKAEVDDLFAEWKSAQAKMLSEPEDKPWKLREFLAADLDGNLIRVFYDFQGDAQRNDRQSTPRPLLSAIEAQLFVANIKRSCDFYTDKLGFAVKFTYGDPPHYGQVVRDNARLNFRLIPEPVFVAEVRQREHLLSASITVATANEIEQLFLIYQAAEVSFHQTLKTEPWGARTFVVSDPDENLILFAGPAGG
jgi:catechol 2,3-dioxygenase-like lactoylglutathione lyase family enzyme